MKPTSYERIMQLLEEAEDEDFFGEITFRFRNGNIYHVLKSQSLLFDELK